MTTRNCLHRNVKISRARRGRSTQDGGRRPRVNAKGFGYKRRVSTTIQRMHKDARSIGQERGPGRFPGLAHSVIRNPGQRQEPCKRRPRPQSVSTTPDAGQRPGYRCPSAESLLLTSVVTNPQPCPASHDPRCGSADTIPPAASPRGATRFSHRPVGSAGLFDGRSKRLRRRMSDGARPVRPMPAPRPPRRRTVPRSCLCRPPSRYTAAQ